MNIWSRPWAVRRGLLFTTAAIADDDVYSPVILLYQVHQAGKST